MKSFTAVGSVKYKADPPFNGIWEKNFTHTVKGIDKSDAEKRLVNYYKDQVGADKFRSVSATYFEDIL